MCHKLKEIREDNGLSVADLVVLSEISSCTIYRIESGDTTFKVNIGTAEALAYALDVEVCEIFASAELSHIGRPPHTGRPIGVVPQAEVELCSTHFIELSVTGECGICDSQPAVRHLAAVG